MEQYDNELYHYGVKGMKWGRRRPSKAKGYKSLGVRSAMARRANDKIDAGFSEWGENTKKKENAIELGKTANVKKMAYEQDKGNKTLKKEYRTANEAYKKALRSNTTYRKGAIRKEVGQDMSRKYLSEAKKTKKLLNEKPDNAELQKKYNSLMSKHDVERAKARRAPEVAANRSRTIASIKRGMTMSIKSAAVATAIAGGTYAANKYMSNHQVTLNGQPVRFSSQTVSNIYDIAKAVKRFMSFMY